MLRQELEPVIDPTYVGNFNNYTADNRCGLRLAPDQTKGCTFTDTNGGSSSAYFTVTSTGLSPVTGAAAAFAGEINDCFTSNDYYGFVGQSTSYINAFRWSDHSLVTLTKTGLGTVYRCSIAPDGFHLAVTHSTTPFLRVYNLNDGTYVDAATAASNYSICSYTGDGNNLIVVGSASPYVAKYTPDLATKTTISTSSSYATNSNYINGYQHSWGNYCMPHPLKPNSALIGIPTTTSPYLIDVDGSANTISNAFTGTTTYLSSFAVDTKFSKLYTFSGTNTYGSDAFRRFDALTYAGQDMSNASYMATSGQSTSGAPSSAMIVVNANTGTITGTVRDVDNNPAARTVRAYRRSDGLLVAQTTSDGVTGNYTIITPTSDTEAYDVQFVIESGELLNDLFYARVTPAAVA